jgi:hypothetical protein
MTMLEHLAGRVAWVIAELKEAVAEKRPKSALMRQKWVATSPGTARRFFACFAASQPTHGKEGPLSIIWLSMRTSSAR